MIVLAADDPSTGREAIEQFRTPQPGITSAMTVRFGAFRKPLADARVSDRSRDGNGAVAENRAKPRGQRISSIFTCLH